MSITLLPYGFKNLELIKLFIHLLSSKLTLIFFFQICVTQVQLTLIEDLVQREARGWFKENIPCGSQLISSRSYLVVVSLLALEVCCCDS